MGSGRPTNRRAAFSVWQCSCSVLVLIGRLLLLCRVRRGLGEKKKKEKTNEFSSIPRTRSKVPLLRPPATQHTASRTHWRAFYVTANSIDRHRWLYPGRLTAPKTHYRLSADPLCFYSFSGPEFRFFPRPTSTVSKKTLVSNDHPSPLLPLGRFSGYTPRFILILLIIFWRINQLINEFSLVLQPWPWCRLSYWLRSVALVPLGRSCCLLDCSQVVHLVAVCCEVLAPSEDAWVRQARPGQARPGQMCRAASATE